MQKSYVVKSPINFANFAFFVRIGDILLHDAANGKLTVYRGGEIVKAIVQTSLGIAALLKQGFISEVVQQPTTVSPSPRAPEAPKKAAPAPSKPVSTKEETEAPRKRKAKLVVQDETEEL